MYLKNYLTGAALLDTCRHILITSGDLYLTYYSTNYWHIGNVTYNLIDNVSHSILSTNNQEKWKRDLFRFRCFFIPQNLLIIYKSCSLISTLCKLELMDPFTNQQAVSKVWHFQRDNPNLLLKQFPANFYLNPAG